MTHRRKILFLTPCWPLGRTYGGQLRALHTARALQQIGEVTVLVVGSEAGDREAARLTATEFKTAPAAPAPTYPQKNLIERLRRAVDLQYLNVHGCVVSPEDRARVTACIEHHDLAWVLNSRTANLLQIGHWPHGHLDIDDLPSIYLQRTAATERAALDRWKARTQRVLLHRRERHFTSRFTTVSVCSEADRDYLGSEHVHVIPNGFARPATEPRRAPAPQPLRIGFIGLYSYAPNFDGVQWFLNESWPAIRRALPGVRFRLVGQDTDGPLQPTAPDVDALGWLDNPAEEIATWSAMVVPIRLGGGTRIKLADAFSRKCPVVATRFGAYGYEVQSGRHLLLADDAAAFACACIHLLRHPELAQQIADTAWREFLRRWTWEAITPKIWTAAEDCLRRSAQVAAL